MKAHERVLSGDPLHPPGWKRGGVKPYSPTRVVHSPAKRKAKKYLKPLPGRAGQDEQEDYGFDNSLMIDRSHKTKD